MNDIIIHLIKFPNKKVKACTVQNEDGDYIVFVNEHLNEIQQRAAMRHELLHIENIDFEKEDVQRIEYHAH